MGQNLGIGRVLVAAYAVFAISSSARASFQIITKFEQAPLAYSLSLFSALIYLAITFLISNPKYRRFSSGLLWVELVGVLVVGTLSFTSPALFAHPSVWSGYGSGYAFVPLVLPLLGILWLRRHP